VKILVEADIDPAVYHKIEDSLNQFNMDTTGDHEYAPVHVILRDDDGGVKGGALGGIWGKWLYLKYLWVSEEVRGQGYGSQLLAAVEAQAIQAQCHGIYLETFDFQAYSFYVRYGFEAHGQLEGFPPGHTLYHLSKRLV
jgi:GNAT superfamily N-acetyltransferase